MAKKKKKAAKAAKAPIATTKSPSSGKTLLLSDPDLSPEERSVVEAVKEFETAEKSIALFEQENEQVMSTYKALLEEREQKRQNASQLVRALDVSCGQWDRYTARTNYDVDTLAQYLGRQKFLDIGGTVGTAAVYTIDSSKIELAISNGAIPTEMVPAIKRVSPSYHEPDAS